MNFWAKKRKGDLVLSQRGIRAVPHVIPQNSFLLLPSKANCFPVYRKLIMWSTIKCKRPWKLAIFRQKVFLTRLGLRFTYVNQACHFETNQVHVGGALGERHEINKGSLEIFACILLSNRMIRLCGKFYPCSFIPNCTWLFKFACI